MSKIINNKQNNLKKKKLNNKCLIIGFSSLIILLLLLLVVILFNTKHKSDNKLINKFNSAFSSNDKTVIFYYDSDSESKEYELDIDYLNQLKRDYNIKILYLDKKLLQNSKLKEIESKLGVSNKMPVLSIVGKNRVFGGNDGVIESHNLVKLLINLDVLDKNSTYKDIDNIKFIDYSTYNELLDSDDNTIIVIGRTGCKYCAAVKPILNNISKAYKVDINYLDINDIEKENLKKLFEKLPDIGYDSTSFKDEGIFNMPTLFIVKKGKIKAYIENLNTLEEYVNFLKNNEVIE